MNFDSKTRARLVGVFIAEAEETLATLRQLASDSRRDPGEAPIRDFARSTHGLKGAAASIGYGSLAGALHAVEALALGIPGAGAAGAAERRNRIDAALELLGEGVGRMAASHQDGFPEDLLDALRKLVDAKPGDAGKAASPSTRGASARGSEGGEHEAENARGDGERGRRERIVERISVPAVEMDEALRLASSMARSAGQLQEALERAGSEHAAPAQLLTSTAGGLEGIIGSLRLVPAETALSGLEEEVAELAARLDKRVALVVTGREVRADRGTLQTARGMIRHLVRNALDHGIELASDRAAAGKPEEGRLAVAIAAGNSVLRVSVADDGAGFDTVSIRRNLEERAGEGRVASLSDEEVIRAWALEGGSTRASATEISGRGLGLSAVVRTARAAGGGVGVRSVKGKGSTVELTLPLEIYAVEALTVTAGGRCFGIPLSAVEGTVLLTGAGSAIQDGPTGRTLTVGETILDVRNFADVLGLANGIGRERFAVVIRSEDALAAMSVEGIGAVEGIVPAAVPGVATSDALVTGIARLGDGSAVALLNPRMLVTAARATRTAARPVRDAPAVAAAAGRREATGRGLDVLLAEDSLATREVLRVLLEEQGFKVRVAADGEEALERISERAPDVLVSDINMPRRDGLSLTRLLRGRPSTERLPIVLLTSQDDDAMRGAGAAAGADAYLVKSRFNADVLEETLARLGVRAK